MYRIDSKTKPQIERDRERDREIEIERESRGPEGTLGFLMCLFIFGCVTSLLSISPFSTQLSSMSPPGIFSTLAYRLMQRKKLMKNEVYVQQSSPLTTTAISCTETNISRPPAPQQRPCQRQRKSTCLSPMTKRPSTKRHEDKFASFSVDLQGETIPGSIDIFPACTNIDKPTE